jgi:hypothetical protein
MRPTEDLPKQLPVVQPRITSSTWSDPSAIRRLVALVCSKWLRVLAAPRASTFTVEMQYASWEQIGIGLGLIGVAWMASEALRNHVDNALSTGVFHATLALLASGVFFVAARTVGRGIGDYKTQTHLYLLYHAPLSITLAVIALTPAYGGVAVVILSPFLSLYGLILSYFMLQAAHRITRRRAFLTLLVLVLIAVAITLLVILFLLIVIAAVASLLSQL